MSYWKPKTTKEQRRFLAIKIDNCVGCQECMHKEELKLMQIAYEIGKYIQSFVTTKVGDWSRPWSNYEPYFKQIPSSNHGQTKEGLILQEYYGMPSKIITPWGGWNILGSGGSRGNQWRDLIQNYLVKELGLVLYKSGVKTEMGYYGPYWKIKNWKGTKLPEPKYKKYKDYLDYDTINRLFLKFSKNKPELL